METREACYPTIHLSGDRAKQVPAQVRQANTPYGPADKHDQQTQNAAFVSPVQALVKRTGLHLSC
jgi:hypothetical protein